MFARFDENPAMTLRVIKETKRYGRTDGRTDARTDNVKTVYPLQTKFAGGIMKIDNNHSDCLLEPPTHPCHLLQIFDRHYINSVNRAIKHNKNQPNLLQSAGIGIHTASHLLQQLSHRSGAVSRAVLVQWHQQHHQIRTHS